MDYTHIIDKHERIALQFSGGKDSLACLYLLKPHWDKITVYYVNSGDPFPETTEVVNRIRNEVPHFVEIKSDVEAVHAKYGICTDLLPCSNTALGRMFEGNKPVQMIDRYTCLFHWLAIPLHKRMVADGITLIIRGQKNADHHGGPYRNGDKACDFNFEFFYPIETWTDNDVFAFLHRNNVEIPNYYKEGMNCAPDSMSCTCWTDHKIQDYVKRHYPDKYREMYKRLIIIARAVQPHYEELKRLIVNGQ